MSENSATDSERSNEELSRKAHASAESTGGIGTNYEGDAIAIYLAAMLAQSGAPGVLGAVVGLAAQQRSNGRPLDDLVVLSRGDKGEDATLDLQMKHRLTLSAAASNTNFAEIVGASWDTIQLPSFNEGRDRAGGAAEIISADSYYACEKLAILRAFRAMVRPLLRLSISPAKLTKKQKLCVRLLQPCSKLISGIHQIRISCTDFGVISSFCVWKQPESAAQIV